jgi:hypothetical protein
VAREILEITMTFARQALLAARCSLFPLPPVGAKGNPGLCDVQLCQPRIRRVYDEKR